MNTTREKRQILDTLSGLWSRLWSSDEDEGVTEDVALAEFGEWPWQVSLMHWADGRNTLQLQLCLIFQT